VSILCIAVLGVICGADSWVEIEVFGKVKRRWLKKFLPLPHGIPSHDTFGRVFARVDAEEFERCFLDWVQAVSEFIHGQVITIDGKTLRGSFDRFLGQGAIQMVSAWATTNRLVLGQVAVKRGSNEITAIPALVQLLELSGCIVTIDAIGCQKEIAEAITARGADYVLALKENQELLYADVESLFEYAQEVGFKDVPHHFRRTDNKGHGRIETRRCWTTSSPEFLAYVQERGAWPGLRSIGMVVCQRRIGETTTIKTRYYLSSLASDAEQMLQAVRTHWSIENNLHWMLDIAFREDDSRIRRDNGPRNLATLRQIALQLLRRDQTAKCGVKGRRLMAGWDPDYLIHVLFG
jgi:predicted transposase YbfD/YdcC